VVEDAGGELYERLVHQGLWICSAAPAALPYLTDLAAGKAIQFRVGIMELIGTLAQEAVLTEPHLVDPAWWPALDKARPRLLALLEDPDPSVREEAISLAAVGTDRCGACRSLVRVLDGLAACA
jgi:hypothetical protein